MPQQLPALLQGDSQAGGLCSDCAALSLRHREVEIYKVMANMLKECVNEGDSTTSSSVGS
jgi:hypothetical protein